jgi:hypothetical protein
LERHAQKRPTGKSAARLRYDTWWSYAIRSLNNGAKNNNASQPNATIIRVVIGCCIQLAAANSTARDNNNNNNNNNNSTTSSSNSTSNYSIRFFNNGNCLGKFAIVKGKLDGGVAYTDVAAGTYYPAVSCYLGGVVRAQF